MRQAEAECGVAQDCLARLEVQEADLAAAQEDLASAQEVGATLVGKTVCTEGKDCDCTHLGLC